MLFICSPFINAQTLAHMQTTSYLRPHERWIAIGNSLRFYFQWSQCCNDQTFLSHMLIRPAHEGAWIQNWSLRFVDSPSWKQFSIWHFISEPQKRQQHVVKCQTQININGKTNSVLSVFAVQLLSVKLYVIIIL